MRSYFTNHLETLISIIEISNYSSNLALRNIQRMESFRVINITLCELSNRHQPQTVIKISISARLTLFIILQANYKFRLIHLTL